MKNIAIIAAFLLTVPVMGQQRNANSSVNNSSIQVNRSNTTTNSNNSVNNSVGSTRFDNNTSNSNGNANNSVGNSNSSNYNYNNTNSNSTYYNNSNYNNSNYNNGYYTNNNGYYNNNNYNNGYNNSYNNGYNNGYTNGYNNGYTNGTYYNNSTYGTTTNSYNNGGNNSNSIYTVKDDKKYGSEINTSSGNSISKYENNTTDMVSNYSRNSAINTFFYNNQKMNQTFIINAQQENTLKGSDGTIIKIEPNSFVTSDGKVVQGDVEFELKEVFGKNEMIGSNAHTVSNDQPLVSTGELFMGANQGSTPLRLADDKPVAIQMPARSKETMQLFNGRPNGNTINWTPVANTGTNPVANPNSPTGSYYNFTSNSLNWINGDKFMRNNGPTTKVNVRMPKQFDTTNTAVFMVFKDQNTVTRFDSYVRFDDKTTDLNHSSFDTRYYSVPVNTQVTFVAVSKINGQYYSCSQPALITKDYSQVLELQATTEADIQNQLKALN